ncbi:helix-turn-helix domain-containing protein [Pseudooceanicola sp. CBS1P-1]|uniref:AraC-like ligand-binding domain-containing protein n=1 Tax=Pseudooceanicola TaxID=1679449 RepID=UPI00136BA1E4|nr:MULTISPECIES: helix-turn-helix domain-containing protein [Pseudooceanicola]MBT9384313.1 helix-turn-helix domain-containing protein [Pseudooceanicola endophyticus]
MQSLSTQRIPSKDILAYWSDVVCRTYAPVTADFPTDRPFAARLDIKQIGRTSLTRVRSSDALYRRTPDNIRTSQTDDYLLALPLKGQQAFSQAGRTTRLGAGDLCLIDTARPYDLSCEDYEALHLKVPRAELDLRLPRAEAVSAMRVAAAGRYARLASTMLRATMETVDSNDSAPLMLSSTLIDLVALAFDECFNGISEGDGRYGRIVEQAQAMIRERLFDPDFDVACVPSAIGVSARTLSRAFAQRGITPAKWMWGQRLEAARTMLRTGNGRHSVSEVAMKCGFNDFSHFSRAFKARYGQTPSATLGEGRCPEVAPLH